jgi:intracellular septation protein
MTENQLPQWQKLLLDLGPLVVFFAGNKIGGIFWATGAFMIATLIALVITYVLTKHISKMLLFTAVLVGIFGSLTLYLHNDLFIKIKVTLLNGLFGAILLGGLKFDRLFLKDMLGGSMQLAASAWRTLTLRWSIFFFILAGMNEIVWRNFSNDTWVNFKAFGLLGLTLVFAFANAPFMAKHMIEDGAKPSGD